MKFYQQNFCIQILNALVNSLSFKLFENSKKKILEKNSTFKKTQKYLNRNNSNWLTGKLTYLHQQVPIQQHTIIYCDCQIYSQGAEHVKLNEQYYPTMHT